jgi:hypothetical protein
MVKQTRLIIMYTSIYVQCLSARTVALCAHLFQSALGIVHWPHMAPFLHASAQKVWIHVHESENEYKLNNYTTHSNET